MRWGVLSPDSICSPDCTSTFLGHRAWHTYTFWFLFCCYRQLLQRYSIGTYFPPDQVPISAGWATAHLEFISMSFADYSLNAATHNATEFLSFTFTPLCGTTPHIARSLRHIYTLHTSYIQLSAEGFNTSTPQPRRERLLLKFAVSSLDHWATEADTWSGGCNLHFKNMLSDV